MKCDLAHLPRTLEEVGPCFAYLLSQKDLFLIGMATAAGIGSILLAFSAVAVSVWRRA